MTDCIIEECLRAINYLCFDFASLELRSAEFKIQIVMKLKISYFVSLISRLPRKEKLPKYKINVNPNLENVENIYFYSPNISCLRGWLW